MENFMLWVGVFVLCFVLAVVSVAIVFYAVCFVIECIEEIMTKKTKTDKKDCERCEYAHSVYCGVWYPREKMEKLVRSGERFYLRNYIALSNENPYIKLLRLGDCMETYALCTEHGTILYVSEKMSDIITCCMILKYAPTKDGKKSK